MRLYASFSPLTRRRVSPEAAPRQGARRQRHRAGAESGLDYLEGGNARYRSSVRIVDEETREQPVSRAFVGDLRQLDGQLV
ncbi:predicted protein [Streptomyces sp. C]|nr:predicted protein [Streptomyces sp. C]